jgi:hypothetical protein
MMSRHKTVCLSSMIVFYLQYFHYKCNRTVSKTQNLFLQKCKTVDFNGTGIMTNREIWLLKVYDEPTQDCLSQYLVLLSINKLTYETKFHQFTIVRRDRAKPKSVIHATTTNPVSNW